MSNVECLFNKIKELGLPLDIAVYNVDSNIPSPLLETDTETFTKLWQQNCLGAFLFGKAALNLMLDQSKGAIIKNKGQDGLLKLEAIAETYWTLHQQDPSAWTHELDIRPYKEHF